MPSYGNPWANPFQNPSVVGQIKVPDFFEDESGSQAALAFLLENLNAPTMGKNWLGNQYQKLYQQYAGRQAVDPTMKWFDYLKGLDLGGMYNSVSPYERGERTSVYAPKMRWI